MAPRGLAQSVSPPVIHTVSLSSWPAACNTAVNGGYFLLEFHVTVIDSFSVRLLLCNVPLLSPWTTDLICTICVNTMRTHNALKWLLCSPHRHTHITVNYLVDAWLCFTLIIYLEQSRTYLNKIDHNLCITNKNILTVFVRRTRLELLATVLLFFYYHFRYRVADIG